MEKKYKYLHVAIQGGRFLSALTDTLGETPDILHPEQHLFVTSTGASGDYLSANHSSACEVIRTDENEIDYINDNGADFEFIFIHGFHSPITKILHINPKLDKKIIWRTWGHDIRLPSPNPTNPLKTVYRYLMFFLFKCKVRRFYAVGVPNIVDEIKVKKAFGDDIKLVTARYTGDKVDGREMTDILADADALPERNDGIVRILVGHSGIDTDDHINVLKQLTKFKDENITVTLPLSYGNPEYIEKVKKFAVDNFGEKCEIISEKMPYAEYAAYIKSIDIAVFNMKDSAALGNVTLLAYFKKKMFVNRYGDLKAAFDESGLDCGVTDEIDGMSFAEFIRPSENPDKMQRIMSHTFGKSTKDIWIDLITGLENGKRKKEKRRE